MEKGSNIFLLSARSTIKHAIIWYKPTLCRQTIHDGLVSVGDPDSRLGQTCLVVHRFTIFLFETGSPGVRD